MKVGRRLHGFGPFKAMRVVARLRNRLGERAFTIVETMIVLAVTGALFLVAAVAISGRTNETAFEQAINSMPSVLQQTISQVSSGDYEGTTTVSCSAGASALIFSKTAPAGGQGSSTDCIYLGKVMQFGVSSASSQQEYQTYPIAGLRQNGGGSNFSSAQPTAVAPDPTATNVPDESTIGYLLNGLTVACMKYFSSSPGPGTVCSGSAGGTNIGAVGFVSGLGDYNFASTTTPTQQQFYLVPVIGSAINEDENTMVSAINSNIVNSFNTVYSSNTAYSVQICFNSGGTTQSGLITIGGNGGNGNLNSITTKIFDGQGC